MKKLITVVCIMLISVSSFGQGGLAKDNGLTFIIDLFATPVGVDVVTGNGPYSELWIDQDGRFGPKNDCETLNTLLLVTKSLIDKGLVVKSEYPRWAKDVTAQAAADTAESLKELVVDTANGMCELDISYNLYHYIDELNENHQ